MIGRILVLGIILALFAGAGALEPKQWRPRVDVSSRDEGVELKMVTMPKPRGHGYNAGWYKTDAENKRYLTFRKMLPTTEWTPMEMSFQSNKDTKVSVRLSVKYEGKDAAQQQPACLFDALEVEGATIANGSFEETEERKEIGNAPQGWHVTPKEERRAEFLTDPAIAKDGKNCVKVTAGRAVAQSISVKAGETVKIKLWAKRVE